MGRLRATVQGDGQGGGGDQQECDRGGLQAEPRAARVLGEIALEMNANDAGKFRYQFMVILTALTAVMRSVGERRSASYGAVLTFLSLPSRRLV